MVQTINNHLNTYQLMEFMNTFGKMDLILKSTFVA